PREVSPMNARLALIAPSWLCTLIAQTPTATPAASSLLATFEHLHITSQRIADTNGDGQQELVLVCHHAAAGPSRLLCIGFDTSNQQLIKRGEIALSDPAHTLIAIADLLPGMGDEVILATPQRTFCISWTTNDAAPGKEVVLA